MRGFGATFGGDDEEVVESSGAGDTQVSMDANPLAAGMLADDMVEDDAGETDVPDMLQARRIMALPVDEMYAELENGDASPKTKLVAISMRLELHQAQFDQMCRAKEALAIRNGQPAPWWHTFGQHRTPDSRYAAFARGKAESAFRDAGGRGPFAAVTTAKAAVRFAVQLVLGKMADGLDRLARRFE